MSVMKSRGVAVLVSGAGLLSLALGCDGVKVSKCDGLRLPAPEKRHVPVSVMGRDYWPLMFDFYFSDPNYIRTQKTPTNSWMNVPELNDLPMFRDCALVYSGLADMPPAGKATLRTVREHFAKNLRWDSLALCPKMDKPALLGFHIKRGMRPMAGEIDLDYEDYRDFMAVHTNILYVGAAGEFANESQRMLWFGDTLKDPSVRQAVTNLIGRRPTDRYEHAAFVKRVIDRQVALHYGDLSRFSAMCEDVLCEHLTAVWGAKLLSHETTNTTVDGDDEYRWDVVPMFARGAARQFGLPWHWFIAIFMNGYTEDGRFLNNSCTAYSWYNPACGSFSPKHGVSQSLNRRAFYLAYLSGANFVEMENWFSVFLQKDAGTGKARLSPRGEDYRRFHDFTVAHPNRGTPYTPVAILVPLHQGCSFNEGYAWAHREYGYMPGDLAVDSVLYTIIPGFERRKAMKAGREANLHNTPYALMYDVVCPDSGQDPEELLDVMKSYRALVLVGDYRDRSFEPTLARYEAEGGRVVRIDPSALGPVDPVKTQNDVRTGRRRFPQVADALASLQRDLFPIVVDGSCEYGLNVGCGPKGRGTEKAWLWVFNNSGITKFADVFQKIDGAADSRIRVDVSKAGATRAVELVTGKTIPVTNGKFESVIPAGDLAVFELSK